MTDNMEQGGPAMTEEEAIPYEQEFETELEREVTCEGAEFVKVKNYESVQLCTLKWGRIPFEITMERIGVSEETHKDLILNVVCNKRGHDSHWRCSFTATAQCIVERQDDWESAEKSMTASKGCNTLVIPIMRCPEDIEHATFAVIKVKIKINSWAGTFPAMLKSFTQKTTITDAVLQVQGRRLYVTRAILAMHSTYFHTLFYDNRFNDAAKTEFDLSDVSLDEMTLFLNIIYPNATDDRPLSITSMETIESLLILAERFGADCVKRLMEKYLMGEMTEEIEGFTLARRLLISDRFRLSAPSTLIMEQLRDERELRRLGETEEYHLLSDATRASILDMRMQPSEKKDKMDEDDVRTFNLDSDDDAIGRMQSFLSRPFVPPWPLPPPPALPPSLKAALNVPQPPPFPPRPYHSTMQWISPQQQPQQQQQQQQQQQRQHLPNFPDISFVRFPPSPTITPPSAPSVIPYQWTNFQSDLGRLDAAIGTIAVSLSQSNRRDAALQFLRAMTRAEFDQIPSQANSDLRLSIISIIYVGRETKSILVDRFIRVVEEIRSAKGPSSSNSLAPKRRREE